MLEIEDTADESETDEDVGSKESEAEVVGAGVVVFA